MARSGICALPGGHGHAGSSIAPQLVGAERAGVNVLPCELGTALDRSWPGAPLHHDRADAAGHARQRHRGRTRDRRRATRFAAAGPARRRSAAGGLPVLRSDRLECGHGWGGRATERDRRSRARGRSAGLSGQARGERRPRLPLSDLRGRTHEQAGAARARAALVTCRRSWPAPAWAPRSPTPRSPRRRPPPSPARRATAS